MSRSDGAELSRLRRDIERALVRRADADDLLPLLAKLARGSAENSEDWLFAHRHLAALAVGRDPWRASLFARRVAMARPDDDGAWALLGLSQSLLGNYVYAARAYERALRLSPDNPWYAHNLGHLYDVALKRPEAALSLLARATDLAAGEAEIAASYAHALARSGKLTLAKRVLKRVIKHGGTSEQMALWRWLEGGAAGASVQSNAPSKAGASSRKQMGAPHPPDPGAGQRTRKRAKRRRTRPSAPEA